MRTKRYSVEQIVAKLREAERLQAQGLTIPQASAPLDAALSAAAAPDRRSGRYLFESGPAAQLLMAHSARLTVGRT